MTEDPAGGDSLRVAVHMGLPGDSLAIPVKAFEILMDIPAGWTLLSANAAFTLTERSGWTTAINADRGWIGGFSSSLDAIKTGGVLIGVLFKRPTETEGKLCMQRVRLNSGSPESDLGDACLSL